MAISNERERGLGIDLRVGRKGTLGRRFRGGRSPFSPTADISVRSAAGFVRKFSTRYLGRDAVTTVIVDDSDTAPFRPSD